MEAFNPGAQVVKLQDDLVVYRYYGGAANPRGRWVTTEKLSAPINKLALPPGSTAEYVTKWIIHKGTEVLQGTVAPNFGRSGGAVQIYLPNPSVLK
ncbi:glycohydrolase toxin TNT-related protein [Geobacillus icigianus]|uniref:glycohydrolase toxin TNT-related protein n=1 Tax=Geobacillus TaxID=129337 RepID=UPI0009ED1627